jgi:ATP-binding cassette subfamily B protein
MADLRAHVFQFVHRLRVGFFENQPVGRLVTRVTNDVDAISEVFSSGALNAFGDLIRLVGIVVMMLVLDLQLSLIAFAALPPIALVVWLVRRRARLAFREIRAKTARMNANMNEQVNGITLIQAYDRQDAAEAEFDEINIGYREANLRAIKYDAVQDAAMDAVHSIALALIIVALGYHEASFGTVVAFSAYLSKFFEPLSALAQRYTLLQSALSGAERVFRLLDTDAPDAPKRPGGTDGSPEFAFELNNVNFAYKKGTPVLRDISLSARVGEKIALVGPTGSGKTTVNALLLRLYEAEQGSVRVQGRDVRSLDRDELRSKFAVVPQDVFLFPATLAENVAAGKVPDQARVAEVLRRIGAYDLLALRNGGLSARVEEHGANFSLGERQLIAFARALYRDAPILILDEATASVDSDTESRLQKALEELLKGRTALVIAHRLSTIRAADTICVLQGGEIVERGSHDELLQTEGVYTALYRLQFAKQRSTKEAAPAQAHGHA